MSSSARPRSRRSTRSTLVTALALSGLLALTACGGGGNAEADAADAGTAQDHAASSTEATVEQAEATESAQQLRSGVATVLSRVPDLDFTEVEQDESTLVEVLGARYTVAQAFQGTTVHEDLATELEGYGADFSGEVRAADGETLVVAVIRADTPEWAAGASRRTPETEARILLDGNPVGQVGLRISPGEQSTVALSVPEDVQPADLVLDVAQAGANQQLSLVDGSRTASDVEHIYARATEVSVGDPRAWDVGFTGFTGDQEHLTGEVVGASIVPVHPEHGWANPGNVFLGIDITTNRLNGTDDDESTAVVTLEDGTTQRWLEDPSSLTHRFNETVWYQVPADTDAATLDLDITVKAGISDPKSLDRLKVPLTFSGSVAGDGRTSKEPADGASEGPTDEPDESAAAS